MVSIIVPVYNAEKYLRECIESLMNQTYRDIEIILVDDGSNDSSAAICDKYAAKDSRIKVIHKPNGGVTAARRDGVNAAKGEHISFVDADDYLYPNAIELLADKLSEENISLVIARLDHNATEHNNINKVISAEEFRHFAIKDTFSGPCAKLYSKALFTEYVFDIPRSVNIGEDWLMNVRIAFSNNKSVRIIPDIIYHYRQHADSAMHSRELSFDCEYLLYRQIRNAIPKDCVLDYLPSLLENKLSFLRHIFCYRGFNPSTMFIGSDMYKVLNHDIALVDYPVSLLEKEIFFKAHSSKIRKALITLWKIKRKLKL